MHRKIRVITFHASRNKNVFLLTTNNISQLAGYRAFSPSPSLPLNSIRYWQQGPQSGAWCATEKVIYLLKTKFMML